MPPAPQGSGRFVELPIAGRQILASGSSHQPRADLGSGPALGRRSRVCVLQDRERQPPPLGQRGLGQRRPSRGNDWEVSPIKQLRPDSGKRGRPDRGHWDRHTRRHWTGGFRHLDLGQHPLARRVPLVSKSGMVESWSAYTQRNMREIQRLHLQV